MIATATEYSSRLLPQVVLVEDTVDDELLSMRGIRNSKIPCKVVVQRDGLQAIEHLLDEKVALPYLVILDYHLPGLNAPEVLERVRSHPRTRALPVVVFSSDEADACRENSYNAGANSCVAKPTDPSDYVDVLADVISYWLLRNQVIHNLQPA